MLCLILTALFIFCVLQGIVQGPEEFAEGVALGMRSLFGHAVGMYVKYNDSDNKNHTLFVFLHAL